MVKNKIKLVSLNEIDIVLDIYKRAIDDMLRNQIFQWDELYPDNEIVCKDIETGTLYGYYLKKALLGVVIINSDQSEEYRKIKWQGDGDMAIIVHRLCVAPDHKNQGIAWNLMEFAEKFAKKNGFESIRLDAFTKNPAAIYLYEKLSYKKRGIVTFRKGDFFCLEKMLSE